jgi:hypothetical protein
MFIPHPIVRTFLVSSLLAALAGCSTQESVALQKSEESFTLKHGDTPILTYEKAVTMPPEGVDVSWRRSGYIHPLRAPSGGIVTSIHAEDHYHHMGLWHAWVRAEYGTPEVVLDFWNVGARKQIREEPLLMSTAGRVRYVGTKETRDAGFTVLQEQVAYLDGLEAEPTVILREEFAVDAAFVDGANVVDYVVRQTNASEKTLTFSAYRYGGGLAYRAPLTWNEDNSDYLTSEGLDRTNSHLTRARWIAMFGPAEEGDGQDATVVVLCHPDNHDAPQRLRTWDNGKIFLNWVPIQETSWSIAPGETNIFAYQILVFDGRVGAVTIEEYWDRYAK